MNISRQVLTAGSAMVFAMLISMGVSEAQTKKKPGMMPPDEEICVDGMDCMTDSESPPRKQPGQQNPGQAGKPGKDWNKKPNDSAEGGKDWNNKPNPPNQGTGMNQANKNWRYDPNKHQRRKYKDDRYRYYYGGFWYPEPYWMFPIYGYPGRLSCGEGREIVFDSGFYRVRTIDCSGKYYSYAARRHGKSFRVVVNARNGNIVSVRPL